MNLIIYTKKLLTTVIFTIQIIFIVSLLMLIHQSYCICGTMEIMVLTLYTFLLTLIP